MTKNHIVYSREFRTSAARMLFFAGLFVALSGLGSYAVYDQLADKRLSFDPRLLAWPTLLSILGLLCVYFTADGLRLYFTLRALGHRLGLGLISRLVFINIFFSNITPMATGGGFAQVWFLHRHGVRIGTATAATTIRTVLAVLFIFSLTPVFLLTLDALESQTILNRVGASLALLIVLYLGFFVIVLFRTRWLATPLSSLLGLLRRTRVLGETAYRRWRFRALREMLRFSRSFAIYLRGSPRDVWLSILFTFVFLVSLFSFPALLIASLGYDLDYLATTGLLVVTTFVMYFSPTPGAAGISEGVFGSFFSGMLTPAHLVLVTVAWRSVTIYIGMVVGLFVTQFELGRKGGTA